MTYEPISELRRSQLNQGMAKDAILGTRDAIREEFDEILRKQQPLGEQFSEAVFRDVESLYEA